MDKAQNEYKAKYDLLMAEHKIGEIDQNGKRVFLSLIKELDPHIPADGMDKWTKKIVQTNGDYLSRAPWAPPEGLKELEAKMWSELAVILTEIMDGKDSTVISSIIQNKAKKI